MPICILQGRVRKVMLPRLPFLLAATLAYSQAPKVDYNTYYSFPFSPGVEYKSLSLFYTYGSRFNTFDASASLRWPVLSIPFLRPSVKAGMMRFDSQGSDAQVAVIRSIRFDQVSIPALFAAMESCHGRRHAGPVTITNPERSPISGLTVSFTKIGPMDSPTFAASMPELQPEEISRIEIFATFNPEVFRTECVTPLTGEVIVRCKFGGRAAEQLTSVTYDLPDKSAVTWDDALTVLFLKNEYPAALARFQECYRELERRKQGGSIKYLAERRPDEARAEAQQDPGL